MEGPPCGKLVWKVEFILVLLKGNLREGGRGCAQIDRHYGAKAVYCQPFTLPVKGYFSWSAGWSGWSPGGQPRPLPATTPGACHLPLAHCRGRDRERGRKRERKGEGGGGGEGEGGRGRGEGGGGGGGEGGEGGGGRKNDTKGGINLTLVPVSKSQ